MAKKRKVDIKKVKDYWEKNTPQYWYSKKKINTKEFYDELQKKRYTYFYPYLAILGEFDKHKNEKVLEIGCGQGTDLLQFAKGGAKVTGIDLTKNSIKKTRDMFKVYGYKVDLMTRNAEDLSCFKDNSFDVVYSFGVLHHTPKTQKSINEVYRILKPGGKAIIMLYAKGINYLHKLLYHNILKGEFLKYTLVETISRHSEHKRNSPLTKMYSQREIKKIFHKFKKIRMDKLLIPAFRDKMPKFIYNPDSINDPVQKILGDNLLIKAVK